MPAAPAFLSHPRVTPRAAGVGGLLAFLPGMILDAFKFFPVLTASGSRIPFDHFALCVRQNPARDPVDPFHFNLSASVRGLADLLHGHQQIRRKLKCPTKALKGRTR